MHFHHLLCWCHEAWEQSLISFGISLSRIFPIPNKHDAVPSVVLPIVHCQADFRHPIHTGDQLGVKLKPERIDMSTFQVHYTFLIGEKEVAKALLRHSSLYSATRKRCDLPDDVVRWLDESSLC